MLSGQHVGDETEEGFAVLVWTESGIYLVPGHVLWSGLYSHSNVMDYTAVKMLTKDAQDAHKGYTSQSWPCTIIWGASQIASYSLIWYTLGTHSKAVDHRV